MDKWKKRTSKVSSYSPAKKEKLAVPLRCSSLVQAAVSHSLLVVVRQASFRAMCGCWGPSRGGKRKKNFTPSSRPKARERYFCFFLWSPSAQSLASGLTTFSSLNSYRGAEEAFKIPHQRPVHIENLDEMMWTGGTNLSTAETILAVLPLWRIVE